MNVSITPELERFVQELVASGRYHSASEVFRDGLRLLEQAERGRLLEKWLAEGLTPDERAKLPAGLLEQARSQIGAKIQEGLEALQRGSVVDGDKFFARWKTRFDVSRRGAAMNASENPLTLPSPPVGERGLVTRTKRSSRVKRKA